MVARFLKQLGITLLVCSVNVSANTNPNLEQEFDDSQYFAFSRIYHAKRVIQHLRHFGSNRFASPTGMSAVDYTAPGIQHLVAIADLRTSPVVIALPEQFGPYRSVQIIDLNYRQIFYQHTTVGQYKYVLSHENYTGDKPNGKSIKSQSYLVMVVLRTLSGYPNASYSNKDVRQQVSLSGFSESIAVPVIEKSDPKLVNVAPQDIITWLMTHHPFSPLEEIWLEVQQQIYSREVAKNLSRQLTSKAQNLTFWDNQGLMTGASDQQQMPFARQALGLMFNYPSMAATNRLEVVQRLEQDVVAQVNTMQNLAVKPDNISAYMWGIDTMPVPTKLRYLRLGDSGYHNFNTRVDYQGDIGFNLYVVRANQRPNASHQFPGYLLPLNAQRPFIRSFYYQPGLSLLEQTKGKNPRLPLTYVH
ncbi:DUF1254 domain-containing protein [Thalassotalea litorea]|uniref:DUF1254 domain-containing protein n=1 Tax=Thalassotalea litorea TaxID=2020715 RepID=UPI003736D381